MNLKRMWITTCVICLLDCILLSSSLTGVPRVGSFLLLLSRPVARFVFLYGPFVLAILWLAVFVAALKYHGAKALWLLLALAIVIPATYLHWALVWNCIQYGTCL
jgi:hypothetical protein